MKPINQVALIGDGIENPFNIDAMIHAAEMFNTDCLFRNVAQEVASVNVVSIDCEQMTANYSPILALDNRKNAQLLYGYSLPVNSKCALVAGNERRGISREVTERASGAVIIPMISRRLNCINVAAASAVGLYYLTYGLKGRMQTRPEPQKRRPELILFGGSDHAELGSAIRSAAAFGWNRVFIEDREGVWFGCDRVTRSEGRAAARRGRNPVKLIPCAQDNKYLFHEATIISTRYGDVPLNKADLCRGPNQAIILADESCLDLEAERFERVATKISYARIELPVSSFKYHFRHLASIAMAEISRQVGHKAPWKPSRQEPLYESSLRLLAEERGESVFLEDLEEY